MSVKSAEVRKLQARAQTAIAPHLVASEGSALPSRLLGFLVALLGFSTTLGWLLQVPMMFEIRHGLNPMVFNTGLCFLMAGTALALPALQHARARSIRTAFATAVIGLCGVTLVEIVLDRSIWGIDLAGLHAWYDYGNTRPGRMAPNTAIGFIVAGCAILVGDRVVSRARAIVAFALTFLLLTIGLTGLAGYTLAPELLFNWAKSARMALQTASGMIVLALSLWLCYSRSPWYLDDTYFQEDGKVRMLSAAILILVTTTASLSAFVLQQETKRAALGDKLINTVRARGPWLGLIAKEMRPQAERATVLSRLTPQELKMFNAGTASAVAPKPLAALADDFANQGWRRVVIEVTPTLAIPVLGPAHTQPEFSAPLDEAASVELLWDGELVLRFTQSLREGADAGGARLVMERNASELAAIIFTTQGLGETGEIAACTMRDGMLLCLPTRWQSKPFKLKPKPAGMAPLPMQLALENKRGIVEGLDYRQNNVLAAYGQLAPGLGFVVKQDAMEVYAPIRSSLGIGALMTVLLALGGTVLMVWQLSPLVTRIRRAELVASEAALKMQTLAQHDALTGLPNRALFMDRLATATLRAERFKESVAVVFIDVDGFKGINDTLGHDAGDEVLVHTGQRLSKAVRKTDTVARLGGDEFTIVLEGLSTPLEDVQKIMDIIGQAMNTPFVLHGEERLITLSIGVALQLEGHGAVDATKLLKLADQQMYEAKRGGKNTHRVAVLSGSNGEAT